jgi:hypothetical protein
MMTKVFDLASLQALRRVSIDKPAGLNMAAYARALADADPLAEIDRLREILDTCCDEIEDATSHEELHGWLLECIAHRDHYRGELKRVTAERDVLVRRWKALGTWAHYALTVEEDWIRVNAKMRALEAQK